MIEAQEMLKAMNVASVPYMKDEERSKLHRWAHERAYPKVHDGPAIGPADLAKILGAGKI